MIDESRLVAPVTAVDGCAVGQGKQIGHPIVANWKCLTRVVTAPCVDANEHSARKHGRRKCTLAVCLTSANLDQLQAKIAEILARDSWGMGR